MDLEGFRIWTEEYKKKGVSLTRLFQDLQDFPPLDLRDFPRFIYRSESWAESIGRALPDLRLLAFANILFFLLAFVAFLRYDAR